MSFPKSSRNSEFKHRITVILLYQNDGYSLAEKKGFEPLIPLWGIHDFQSCALDQLRDFSTFAQVKAYYSLVSLAIIMHRGRKVKEYFHFSGKSLKVHIFPRPVQNTNKTLRLDKRERRK